MLFDLRTRGRRRTVQIIYLFLALLMVSGLLLVGVGTGSGGGILNAFTNNGSGSNQNQLVDSQEKAALKASQANPTSAADLNTLVQARWSTASVSPDYNSTTGAFSAAGKRELTALASDWEHYLTLTKTPDSDTALIVSRAYYALGNYAGQANAWEIFANANPTVPKGFECLAGAAYAAKQTRKGDLAAAQALSLVPKAQRFELQQQLNTAKTSDSLAEQCYEGA